MQGFLRRRTPYTILPTPLPDDTHSPLNAFWFPDSPTQDLLAVMDACLHNLYDVPRAKQVFEGLRRDRAGDPILEGRLYNSFLESFLGMAEREEGGGRERWVEEVVSLWRVMESGEEKVGPSGSTYAIMMRVWQK
ncbi:hypothetical protein JAAARDRAFT_61968 [Jaapia argillacea MUCL 33604]|uniref:Uncharacterized protein n=1 Tax=Jaapia argillacea MUCL 33604 TaxID=933084 RepID=A0A067PCI9_9AGAM|nr:hypothetical protein JAAARDRAFT_61968 [Jaapia argillacea MUCL 33604]